MSDIRGDTWAAAADLVIVDVSGPGGVSVCALVRSRSHVPILAVGPSNLEGDVISTLGMGADSYAAFTESPRVLLARLRALLRRIGAPAARSETAFGTIAVDADQRAVTVDGTTVVCPSPDLEILDLLVRRQGGVVRRSELKRAAPLHDLADRTLDFHIRRLRDLLRGVDGGTHQIVNVHSVGFRLVIDLRGSVTP